MPTPSSSDPNKTTTVPPRGGPSAEEHARAAFTVAAGVRIPDATPDAVREARARQQQADRRREQLAVAQARWQCSRVPPRFLDADLRALGDAAPAALRKAVRRLLGLLDAPGTLALVGPRGTGKTWMAVGLVREFCRRGRRGQYARAMDLIRDVRGSWDGRRGSAAGGGGGGASESEVVRALVRADLLVVDEVQVRAASPWENDLLTNLLDGRYAALRSTLVIANLGPRELLAHLGESIASRLQEDGGIVVADWPSFRAAGTARAAAPPPRDANGAAYRYTPVAEGAVPTEAAERRGRFFGE